MKKEILVDCVTCPSLKIEIENVKGQITQFTRTLIVTSLNLSDDEQHFGKHNKKYLMLLERI